MKKETKDFVKIPKKAIFIVIAVLLVIFANHPALNETEQGIVYALGLVSILTYHAKK